MDVSTVSLLVCPGNSGVDAVDGHGVDDVAVRSAEPLLSNGDAVESLADADDDTRLKTRLLVCPVCVVDDVGGDGKGDCVKVVEACFGVGARVFGVGDSVPSGTGVTVVAAGDGDGVGDPVRTVHDVRANVGDGVGRGVVDLVVGVAVVTNGAIVRDSHHAPASTEWRSHLQKKGAVPQSCKQRHFDQQECFSWHANRITRQLFSATIGRIQI
jgi:hypothetical protein